MSHRRRAEILIHLTGAIALGATAPAFADEPGHTSPPPVVMPDPTPMPLPYQVPVMPVAPALPIQDDVRVDLNHTGVLRLPTPASAVVVGNPEVADIAVHSTDTLLVLGRSYGSTNVLAMDAVGHVIGDYTVIVGSREASSKIRVYQGGDRLTFDCTPSCNPAPELGDNPQYVTTFRPEVQPLSNPVASAGGGASVPPLPETGVDPSMPGVPFGYPEDR